MRIVFAGTPDFAVPCLRAAAQRHEVVAVYTQPDRPAGRGRGLTPSPVKLEAIARGLPVLQPESLRKPESQQALRDLSPDLLVVVAYGLILPQAVLDIPAFGCWNVHASLLPRWRGAAPIQRAIMAGDAESGVAVMKMEAGLDTGPVGLLERVAIGPDMTAGELHDRLMIVGGDIMGRALAALERGGLHFTPQPDEGVTYAAKIEKSETRIDWSKPAKQVHDHIRGLSPFPGAWFDLDGVRVKVLRSTLGLGVGKPGEVLDDRLTVACGEGAVRLIEVQKAGSRALAAEEFLRGVELVKGVVLA